MRKGARIIKVIFLAVLVLGIAALAYSFLKDMDGPTVEISPNSGSVSQRTRLKVDMADPSGVRELTVGIVKDGTVTIFFRKAYQNAPLSVSEEVPFTAANLSEGAFKLEVRATDASLAAFGRGNTRTERIEARLDNRPPRIAVKTIRPTVRRGGAAAIRFTTDEDILPGTAGILVAGYFVKAYRQSDGAWVCVYPFPFRMAPQDFARSVEVTATDLAGNVARMPVSVAPVDRAFKNDKITVTDSFLAKVQAKLSHLAPGAPDPMQCYLQINSVERGRNMEKLQQLSTRDSAAAKLWQGAFRQLPRAAVRANFADHRILLYGGSVIGEATHLGLDLASLRQADIPASNNGRVIYAGELGIYGNLVVLDHGLGVLTLYSHMTDIGVKVGDMVAKGDILGHTGETGLAFGDHLHFGVVVGGIEVSPVEWLDPRWVAQLEKNIAGN